ncbi:SRPBCC family protein [Streptacidiphilus sp. PB12-B1b]|uniref:type II toxin-antitoxin system Rv0910 family toxin n=1 Tax=Streptacidiphilus sp. PB12-B1b TaxID=2705012 RepID=UPI0015FBE465|nr:SRPBCC family protein [Streptacidiphilus sp. PB12-B1b]QMU76430.1 SRPBCC family protein [Streptacidiphilus sp. PB12-B1b]
MPEVSVHAVLPAPADKVWAVLGDLARFGEWNAVHAAFPGGAPAAPAVGTVYAERMTLMGMPAEVSWTVAALEPGRELALAGKGPMGIALGQRYLLEPEGEGTRVTVQSTFTGAAVNLMAARIKDATTVALDDSLRRLSALVA